jgi:hypothetical protein
MAKHNRNFVGTKGGANYRNDASRCFVPACLCPHLFSLFAYKYCTDGFVMMNAGGFGGDKHHAQPMAEINTTPMVDLMLVLLVIFIITAPLLTHAVKIDLPQAGSQANQKKPDTIPYRLMRKANCFGTMRHLKRRILPRDWRQRRRAKGS